MVSLIQISNILDITKVLNSFDVDMTEKYSFMISCVFLNYCINHLMA